MWVDYLRAGASESGAALDRLLERGEVVMCGPVAAELLAGAAGGVRERLASLLLGLPWADLDRSGWVEVGRVAAGLRAEGRTVALIDIEIAVAAVAAGAALWSFDTDFERIAGTLAALSRYAPPDV